MVLPIHNAEGNERAKDLRIYGKALAEDLDLEQLLVLVCEPHGEHPHKIIVCVRPEV